MTTAVKPIEEDSNMCLDWYEQRIFVLKRLATETEQSLVAQPQSKDTDNFRDRMNSQITKGIFSLPKNEEKKGNKISLFGTQPKKDAQPEMTEEVKGEDESMGMSIHNSLKHKFTIYSSVLV